MFYANAPNTGALALSKTFSFFCIPLKFTFETYYKRFSKVGGDNVSIADKIINCR